MKSYRILQLSRNVQGAVKENAPAPKPARPAAAAKPAAAPKKETIVVKEAPTKEQVEALGKEIDKLDAQKAQDTQDTTNK